MLITFLTEQNKHLGMVRSDMLPREGDEICFQTFMIQSSNGNNLFDEEYYTVKHIMWRMRDYPSHPEDIKLVAILHVTEIENDPNS